MGYGGKKVMGQERRKEKRRENGDARGLSVVLFPTALWVMAGIPAEGP
jgi:hypothetical protein